MMGEDKHKDIRRLFRKVTSGELLTKEAMRKRILYTKNTYIRVLKILLNVVTDGTELPVVSGNKFLYTCAKQVYRLLAQPRSHTFHQLLIIVEVL
jgi:hypothetical protein